MRSCGKACAAQWSNSPPAEAAVQWIPQGSYDDILFDLSEEGIARIQINRPEKRNAFRPKTVSELFDAFSRVRDNPRVGVVLFGGVGPAPDGGVMPFVPAVIRASAVTGATSVMTVCRG